MRRCMLSAGAALLALWPPAVHAQQVVSGAFVERDSTGKDTLMVERYTRTGDRLEGRVVTHHPGRWQRTYADTMDESGCRSHDGMSESPPVTWDAWYRASLRPDGTISRLELAQDSAFSASTTVQFDGSGATVRFLPVSDRPAQRVEAAGTLFPLLGSIAVMEQAVVHARATGRDSVQLVQLTYADPDHKGAYPLTVVWSGNSVRVNTQLFLEPFTFEGRTDARGLLLAMDVHEGGGTARVERVPTVDVDRFHAAALAYDAGWHVPDEVQSRRCESWRRAGPPPAP